MRLTHMLDFQIISDTQRWIQETEKLKGKMYVDGVGNPAQGSSSSDLAVNPCFLFPRRPWEKIQWNTFSTNS